MILKIGSVRRMKNNRKRIRFITNTYNLNNKCGQAGHTYSRADTLDTERHAGSTQSSEQALKFDLPTMTLLPKDGNSVGGLYPEEAMQYFQDSSNDLFEKNSLQEQFKSKQFTSKKEELLFNVGLGLPISRPVFDEVKDKYLNLKPILMKAPAGSIIHNVNVEINAQGSIASHTAIKCPEARVGCKHDLDAIISYSLPYNVVSQSPYALVKETFDALAPHVERFDLGLKLKDRCVTLEYKDISLDLLPAIPQDLNSEFNTKLWIPEKVSGHDYRLVSGDPIGFQEFFENSAKREFYTIKLSENRMDNSNISVNDLKDPEKYPGVLRLCVVLFKRARDNYFPDIIWGRKAVKSILFTAFFAEKYTGQQGLIHTLDFLTAELYRWVYTDGNQINFNNPVDRDEDLAKFLRESPEKLKAFRDFLQYIRQQVTLLKTSQYFDESSEIMNNLFGEEIVKKHIALMASELGKKQADNKLYMNAAGIISSSGPIQSPRTSFHGDK